MYDKRKAFTLLEVVLALALGGLILATVMTLFVTFVQVMEEKEENKRFSQHVENCVHFLKKHLNQTNCLMGPKGFCGQNFCARRIKSLIGSHQRIFGLTKQTYPPFLLLSTDCTPCSLALIYQAPQLVVWWEGQSLQKKRFGDGVEEDYDMEVHACLLSDCIQSLQCGELNVERGTWSFWEWNEYLRKNCENQNQICSGSPDGLWITFNRDGYEEKRFITLLDTKIFFVQKQLKKPAAREKNADKKQKAKDRL